MVLHILSFLDAKDLVRAGMVNRSWHRLHCEDSLWLQLFQRRFPDVAAISASPLHDLGEDTWRGLFKSPLLFGTGMCVCPMPSKPHILSQRRTVMALLYEDTKSWNSRDEYGPPELHEEA